MKPSLDVSLTRMSSLQHLRHKAKCGDELHHEGFLSECSTFALDLVRHLHRRPCAREARERVTGGALAFHPALHLHRRLRICEGVELI